MHVVAMIHPAMISACHMVPAVAHCVSGNQCGVALCLLAALGMFALGMLLQRNDRNPCGGNGTDGAHTPSSSDSALSVLPAMAAPQTEALLAAVPGMIMQVDRNKVYTWANRAGLEFFGPDVIGRPAHDYLIGEQDTCDAIEPLFDGCNQDIYVKNWQRRRDGQPRLLAWWCTAIRDEQGAVIGAICSAHDITNQHRLQEELLHSEQRFRTIAELAQDAIVMIDADGAVTYWNRAAERIFGYSQREVLGRDVHRLLAPPELHEAQQRAFSHFQRTGQGAAVGKTVELEALTKDGRRIPIELSLSGVPLEGRWHAVAVIRDISERKMSQQALADSEARYRLLAEQASDAIWTTDLDLKFTYVSPASRQLLGYEPEELIGQSVATVLTPETNQQARAALSEELILATEHPGRTRLLELAHRRKDGTLVPVEVKTKILRDELGRFTGVVGVSRDISDRKRAEEQRNHALCVGQALNRLLSLSLENYPMEQLLGRFLDELLAIEWLPLAHRGAMFLVDPQSPKFHMKAQRGLERPVLQACAEVPFGRCLCGRAAEQKRIVTAAHVDCRHEVTCHGVSDQGHVIVPLRVADGELVGLLSLYLASGGAMEETHFGFLQSAAQVLAGMIKRKQAEESLVQKKQLLQVRLRELDCLYRISRVLEDTTLAVPEMIGRAVSFVAGAMQYAELACARIVLWGDSVATENFEETPWKIAAPIWVHGQLAGAVEVCYLQERPAAGTGPFLAEEQSLLVSLAEQLGRLVERNQAEQEVRRLNQQIEFVLGATRTGLDIIDAEGNIVYIDPAWQKQLGDPAGRKCYEYFMGRSSCCAGCGRMKALGEGKPVVTESTMPREGNRPVQITSIPFENDQQRRLVAEVVVDISERKRMEQELAQAQRLEAIGRLAAGIAHEINTPTQYVGDNIRFLQDAFGDMEPLLAQLQQLVNAAEQGAVPDDLLRQMQTALQTADLEYLREEIPNAVQQSLEGVERVAEIVRAMKEFAHPGTAQKQRIDLNQAIASTLTVCRNEWKYVAGVVTDFDTDLPLVPCYPTELNQAILNMVVNAAQAIAEVAPKDGPERGTITIRTRRDGDWAEVRIEDTGPGIAPEVQSKIFEPFFTTKPVGRGSGQGLAIVHATVVNKHGGSVRVESTPGHGATFIVRLPLEQETPSATEDHASETTPCAAG